MEESLARKESKTVGHQAYGSNSAKEGEESVYEFID